MTSNEQSLEILSNPNSRALIVIERPYLNELTELPVLDFVSMLHEPTYDDYMRVYKYLSKDEDFQKMILEKGIKEYVVVPATKDCMDHYRKIKGVVVKETQVG